MKHLIALTLSMVALMGAGTRTLADGDNHTSTPFPDSPFQPDLTPGYVVVGGDIQIPIEQYLGMAGGLIQAAGTFGPATRWPASTVPFDFVMSGVGTVTAPNQTRAINAMAAISARSGVIFRAAVAGDASRVRFQNSQFNNSPVGMIGGTQIINIVSWGEQVVICHEIYHSLGFQHEQSRPDRDTYVTINTANICSSNLFNFDLVSFSATYGPYDFDSLMHYGRADFNCNGQDTITVKAPWNADWQNRIGNRDHFSYYDTINCRARYPAPGDRWLDRNHFGLPFGTFEDPFQSTRLADTIAAVPNGGTLFIKFGTTYNGVGTHTKPITIVAPVGNAVLGN